MTPRAKLLFFRVMAFVVGVGLLLLVAHMVLRYGFDNDLLAWWPSRTAGSTWSTSFATALLGFELRWGLGRMVGVMLAGCVPFLSFWWSTASPATPRPGSRRPVRAPVG
ncbi:DUF3817 domain-containing protein [Serinicoccus marinus]|uniref:DUF3817 domain-containing protein n=1 Tax=Serinicoccus marinus TaxID=247333 RepID=UPI001EE8CCF3|nr:DUF3817 domain-containing protein [Serinicoccus marinus]